MPPDCLPHATHDLKDFHGLLKLSEFAGDLLAPPQGLGVLREPDLTVFVSGLLLHPADESVAYVVHEKVVDLLGDDVRHAPADHIGEGKKGHLRGTWYGERG